jgi:Ran GTPase-activating protein (RanGAP) involved in mRNA processing and transport
MVGALCHSDKLQSISMSRNGCGGISTCRAFGRILVTHALTSLMLSGMNNPILDEQGPSIVSGIRFCRSLCVLDLSANLIGDVTMFEFETACLNHPKHRVVNLEGNIITDQGSYSLSKVSRQFQSLNVSHNKIGQNGIAALLASLGLSNCRLESLYVHRNNFEDTSASGGIGSNGIAQNTTLRTLNLSFMKIEDANSLGAGLIMNKFLVSIDFSQNELECNAVQFMANIASNQHLEFVDFSSNRIRTRGALWILKGLAEKIRSQSKKMIQVHLHKNFYNEQLNDVLTSMNNRQLSAAARIQRYAFTLTFVRKKIVTNF